MEVISIKAGVVHASKDIRFDDISKPVPKEGQVLVKVKYTGICGSDVPRVNGNACHYFPNVLGHEFSGVVAELGNGVTSLKVGDRVSGVPLVPCMKCLTTSVVTTPCASTTVLSVPASLAALPSM